ncbi:hypothetical protein M8J75_008109 [Diaphorina citri]|nr:hypothetical protein M8J75_008109 [Diaphorina citri]
MHSSCRSIFKVWDMGIGRTIAAVIATHIASISVGMGQGFSAILIPQLQKPSSIISISSDDASWIASLGVISTPVGSLFAGIFMDLLGRKTTVQLTAIPFIIGWTIITVSKGFTLLCVGRFITGMAIGMSSACYVYVAEICLPNDRGYLSAFGPVFVSLGVLIVYSLGYIVTWQYTSAACAVVALVGFAAMHAVPETPSWLARQGCTKEARNALVWFRRSTAVADAELKEIQQSLKVQMAGSSMDHCAQTFTNSAVWKPFFILIGFFLFQEASGMYIVLYYAVNFFEDAGSSLDDYVASIIVAGLRFFMAIIGSACIQMFSRRALATTSAFFMALSMGISGTYEYYFSELSMDDRPLNWIPLACILANVCASMLGMLQLPWVMIAELFPLSVRGIMGGIVCSLGYLFIFTTVKMYPDLMYLLNMGGMMWAFSCACLLAMVFIQAFLPETQGKTLLEIENHFRGKKNMADSTEHLEKGFHQSTGSIYTINPNAREV